MFAGILPVLRPRTRKWDPYVYVVFGAPRKIPFPTIQTMENGAPLPLRSRDAELCHGVGGQYGAWVQIL